MNFKDISPRIKTERQLKALIGLNAKQFFILLSVFEIYLQEHKESKHKNKDRKMGSGKKGDIPTAKEKLFFMLAYLKVYPVFDVLGYMFGLSGSSASNYATDLFIVVAKTLNHLGVLPHTEFKTPEELRAAFNGQTVLIIDATERARQRPADDEEQKETYSGKKKMNTDKVTVIATMTAYVLYVGELFKGKNHDYNIFKKEFKPGLDWFKSFIVYVDLGYLGFADDYETKELHIPFKKPRKSKNNPNPTLTEEQKQYNRKTSGVRVTGEHAIRGMKRYNCFSQRCRNRKPETKDFFKLLSAALWNFNLTYN